MYQLTFKTFFIAAKSFFAAKSAWIKYVAIAILTVMVLAYVYSAGKDSERAEWLGKEREFLMQQNAIKEDAKKRIEENQAKYDKILMGAFNNYEQERKNLNNRISELSNQRMYITAAKSSSCDRVPVKTKDSIGIDSSAGRVELSAEDGKNIRNDYGTAQELVEQYKALRNICLPLVEVVE